jgi:twitching motility two-component system response regulator PilG
MLKRLACRAQALNIKGLGLYQAVPALNRFAVAMVEQNMEQHSSALKVMVIDDSKTIRRTAETLLKNVGCEVITAVDGFEALAKIADHHPGIIFVDIMMPRLDGYQTCALIKNNSAFKSTPVIMLSSKDGLFDKAKGRIVGSDQFLTKPFSKEELLNAIKAHVPGFAAVEQAH